MKSKLLASSGSLEGINECINRYFYSNIFIDIENGTVSNSRGIIAGFRVIIKKNRYRFEEI